MRPIRQRLITLIALLILCPALAGPARAATTCSGTVVIGEGMRQPVTSVPNRAFQGACFNALIIDTEAERANYGSEAEFEIHLGKLVAAWTRARVLTAREAVELLAAGLRSQVGRTLKVLRIEEPLPSVPDRMAAPRDPFAGSPAFTVGYTASPGVTPAWPLLRIGFVGAPDGSGHLAGLNVAPPLSDDGSPVFDNAGRLTGIVTSGSDRRTQLLTVSALRRALGELLGAPGDTGDTGSPRIAIDELYERALPVTLQVIVGS